jgi:hypothetical protein
MRKNLLLMRRRELPALCPSFGTAAGSGGWPICEYSLASRRRPGRAARKVLACRGVYWGVPRPQPIAEFRMADRGHRARTRKAKAAQFVSSSFLDWICCCCCVTGLPSLGCINCSSLKLRRMESNSRAEPFAMVCSRCAIVRRESRAYGSEVARARAKQSAARLLNSSDRSDTAAPRRVGGGGMASNHHLVLFTHALCQLSYPAVMKRIKPTYCESVSLSETAPVVTVGAGDGGPAWFASSWATGSISDRATRISA